MSGYFVHREWRTRQAHPHSGIEIREYVAWHADEPPTAARVLGWIVRRHAPRNGWAWYVKPTYGFPRGTCGFLVSDIGRDEGRAAALVVEILTPRLAQASKAMARIDAQEGTAA